MRYADDTAGADACKLNEARMERIPSKADSPAMFDRISARYDLLNHLLSFGLDLRWRNKVARIVGNAPHRVVLDLACGTCDQILATCRKNPGIKVGFGVDVAGRMLEIGSGKIAGRGFTDKIRLLRGDGMDIPMAGDSVDFAMISFGIRNMVDAERSLSELWRVLRPGGSLAVLEFSLPQNPLIRMVYLLYFRWILPVAGALISKDRDAYRYLNRTVEDFYDRERFCSMMRIAGFRGIEMRQLTFGTAIIYIGKKNDI